MQLPKMLAIVWVLRAIFFFFYSGNHVVFLFGYVFRFEMNSAPKYATTMEQCTENVPHLCRNSSVVAARSAYSRFSTVTGEAGGKGPAWMSSALRTPPWSRKWRYTAPGRCCLQAIKNICDKPWLSRQQSGSISLEINSGHTKSKLDHWLWGAEVGSQQEANNVQTCKQAANHEKSLTHATWAKVAVFTLI